MDGIINILKHSSKQLKALKKLYFSNLINKYKTNIQNTWQVIKEALENGQVNR